MTSKQNLDELFITKQNQKARNKNKIGLPPNKRYRLTPLARHKNKNRTRYCHLWQAILQWNTYNPQSFLLFINNQTLRQEIKEIIRSKRFLNDSEKVGVNTYCFKIRIFLTRRFTFFIFRHIHKRGNSSSRRIWIIFHGRKGRP